MKITIESNVKESVETLAATTVLVKATDDLVKTCTYAGAIAVVIYKLLDDDNIINRGITRLWYEFFGGNSDDDNDGGNNCTTGRGKDGNNRMHITGRGEDSNNRMSVIYY